MAPSSPPCATPAARLYRHHAAALTDSRSHDSAYVHASRPLHVKTASWPITLDGEIDRAGVWRVDVDDARELRMTKLDDEGAKVAYLEAVRADPRSTGSASIHANGSIRPSPDVQRLG